MTLPTFRYHPDPIHSGSVRESEAMCACCSTARGYIYTGPVYSEAADFEDELCPWCIAAGSAARKYQAEFIDTDAFRLGTPERAIDEISRRTPGFSSWQGEQWPACCGDATAFLMPAGISEIRRYFPETEAVVLSHIIYDLGISGGAALRKLNALDRDGGPTAFLFQCLACERNHVYVDGK